MTIEGTVVPFQLLYEARERMESSPFHSRDIQNPLKAGGFPRLKAYAAATHIIQKHRKSMEWNGKYWTWIHNP